MPFTFMRVELKNNKYESQNEVRIVTLISKTRIRRNLSSLPFLTYLEP